MSVPAALLAVVALLVLTTLLGLLLRCRDGRRHGVRGLPATMSTAALDRGLGRRATLVQFSTEFCARCPQARRVLSSWAAAHDGIVHAEVDLTHRRDLAVRYGVLSTPTTLLVDAGGAIRSRFTGVPRPAELDSALAALSPVPRPVRARGTR